MASGLPKARWIAVNKANKENLYQLIQEHEDWGICWICGLMKVSRASYYKWKSRCPSQRERDNQILLGKIRAVAESNHSLFGKLAMTDYINHHLDEGEQTVNHKRIYRLMCIHNIRSSRPRYTRSVWKRSDPEEVAENLLNRNFTRTDRTRNGVRTLQKSKCRTHVKRSIYQRSLISMTGIPSV